VEISENRSAGRRSTGKLLAVVTKEALDTIAATRFAPDSRSDLGSPTTASFWRPLCDACGGNDICD
jgi:hypothetical protein